MKRPRRTAPVRRLWRQQHGLRRGYLTDVTTSFLIGVLLVVGGRARTKAPAWDLLNANGGPVVWGAVLIVLGVLLVAAPSWRPGAVVVVLSVLSVFYGLLALWFFRSALPAETGASFIGAVFAARAMVMHLSRAWAYREGPG